MERELKVTVRQMDARISPRACEIPGCQNFASWKVDVQGIQPMRVCGADLDFALSAAVRDFGTVKTVWCPTCQGEHRQAHVVGGV
jgi:hypothetical protein